MSYRNDEIAAPSFATIERVMEIEWDDNCPLCRGQFGWTCICQPEEVGAYFIARREVLDEVERMIKEVEKSSMTRSMTDSRFYAGELTALREIRRVLRAVKAPRCRGCDNGDDRDQSHRQTCNYFSYGVGGNGE